MAWWQNLTRRTRNTENDPIQFPVQFELIPGKLRMRVYLHDLESLAGAVPCWTYVTNGFWEHKQKEFIFSLRRNPEEKAADFSQEPLEFFRAVYRYAEQGRLVDVGDISELATSSLLGHKGLLYISPESYEGIESPSPALTAILLSEEELLAVKQFGPARVMARLGQLAHYYPCPPWSDRTRPSLSFSRSMEESILVQFPRLWMRGIRVRMEDNCIKLRLLPQVASPLSDRLEQLPSESSLALLTEIDPSADGCLVWEPDGYHPSAITPGESNGSHLCGCFMAFVPEQAEDGGKLIEDGFIMWLINESWMAIRQAIASSHPMYISSTDDGLSFQLEWIQTAYRNPFDDSTIYAETGWETYYPLEIRDDGYVGPVNVKYIRLLLPADDVAQRVGVEPFGAYTQAIEDVVRNHFGSTTVTEGQDLIVQFELCPEGKVKVEMASYPGIDDKILSEVYASILALPAPKVNRDSIKFQIPFTIQGGAGSI
jgi:hypothetical protein